MAFLNLRQRTDSVQALLISTPGKVSKQMIRWVATLADESIVLVEGIVQKTPQPVTSASIDDVELHVSKVGLFVLVQGVPELHIATSHIWYRRAPTILS